MLDDDSNFVVKKSPTLRRLKDTNKRAHATPSKNLIKFYKMGVGMRGPGEKQLETDRRLVEKRIHELKTELAQIERRKERQVASIKHQFCSVFFRLIIIIL